MERIEYSGIVFWRSGGSRGAKWAYPGGLLAEDNLQKTLNDLYAKTLNPDNMDYESLLNCGDEFKESGSLGLAVQYYEYAARVSSMRQLQHIFPRLTSCYRTQMRPQKVIDLTVRAKEKFGSSVITPALLTSTAAAYCDLRDYKRAKQCCDRAYAMLNGKADDELRAVYRRLQSEWGE